MESPAPVASVPLVTIPSRFGALTIVVAASLALIGTGLSGFPGDTPLETGIATLLLLTCAGSFLAARSRRITPPQLLDLGLAFQLIVCTGIAALDATTRDPLVVPSIASLILNVFLVAIPLALPSSPSRLIPAGVLCVAMHPLVILLSTPIGKSTALLPEIALACVPTFMFGALGVLAGTSLDRVKAAQQEPIPGKIVPRSGSGFWRRKAPFAQRVQTGDR